MAFRQSYSAVKKTAEPTTFVGKYSMKRVAGLDDVGKEAFIIPLDMDNGYACIPHHVVRKNGDKGFKDSTFNSTKIACHKFDKATGEVIDDLPLCCKLAQMEKDRRPNPDDSNYRALTFVSNRNAFPVLVLSTTEEDKKKKPTIRKISLNGVGFSFLDLAQSSYEQDFTGKIIKQLEVDGVIEDSKDMDPQELMDVVADVLKHSVINVANVEAKSNVPYLKEYTVIPIKNPNIGETSGEGNLIRGLIRLLAGDFEPDKADALCAKYPIIGEIRKQVIDFITLFNDNVDNFVEEWEDNELLEYYNSFVDRQDQIEQYKDYNDKAQANKEAEEDIRFSTPKPSAVSKEDEDEFGLSASAAPAPKKELAAVGASTAPKTEAGFDYSSVSIEEGSILNDVDFADDDFQIDSSDLDDDEFSDL